MAFTTKKAFHKYPEEIKNIVWHSLKYFNEASIPKNGEKISKNHIIIQIIPPHNVLQIPFIKFRGHNIRISQSHTTVYQKQDIWHNKSSIAIQSRRSNSEVVTRPPLN